MAWFDDGGALNVFADVVFCCILLFASYLPHIYGRETWRSTPVVGEGDKAHVEQSVDYFARDGEAPDTVLDDDTVVRPPPEMELPHDENTQIASSADDDDRVEVSSASSSFKHLPRCVALEIMMALPPEVVLALSMTNNALRGLSFSASIWKSHARGLLELSRPLVFPYDVLSIASAQRVSSLSDLLPSTLRAGVLAASRLYDAWSRPHRASFSAAIAQPSSAALLRITRDSPGCVVMHVTPTYLLLVRDDLEVGNGAQELLVWDVARDRCVGRVRLKRALISVKPELTTGSWYCVTGRCLASGEFEFAIVRIQIRETEPRPSLSVNADTINDANIDTTSPSANTLISDTLARFIMLYSAGMDVQVLDVPTRMAVVLFERREPLRARKRAHGRVGEQASTLGLVIVYDWSSGMSSVVDTGIPFTHGTTSVSLHLTRDWKHIKILTETNVYIDIDVDNSSPAPAGERNIRRVRETLLDLEHARQTANVAEPREVMDGVRRIELANKEHLTLDGTQFDYVWGEEALDALRANFDESPVLVASTAAAAAEMKLPMPGSYPGQDQFQSHDVALNTKHELVCEPERSEMMSTQVLNEGWPVFSDGLSIMRAPARSSRVTLYSVPCEKGYRKSGRIWYTEQNYVEHGDEAGATIPSDAALPPPPIIVPLRHPVLIEGTLDSIHNTRSRVRPLMDVSFNYACWIEKASANDASDATAADPGSERRALKIASFRGRDDERLRCGNREPRIHNGGNIGVAKAKTLGVPSEVLCDARHLELSEVEGAVKLVTSLGKMYTYSYV